MTTERDDLRAAVAEAQSAGEETLTEHEIGAARALLATRQDGREYAMAFAQAELKDISAHGASRGERSTRMAWALLHAAQHG